MSDNEEFNEDYEQSDSGSDFADFEGADSDHSEEDNFWLHGGAEGTTPASAGGTTQVPAEASSSSTKKSLPPIIDQASGTQTTDQQGGPSSSGERKLPAEFRYPDPHPWADKQFVHPILSHPKWTVDTPPSRCSPWARSGAPMARTECPSACRYSLTPLTSRASQ
jgi:hypothetical protein